MGVSDLKPIGFVGFGNMGRAIAEGLLRSNIFSTSDFLISVRSENRKKELISEGWKVIPSHEVALNSKVIFLAVKPKDGEKVLRNLSRYLKEKVLVSVMAGIPLKKLDEWSPLSFNVRTMPNINVSVGEGVWGVSFSDKFPEGLKTDVKTILQITGITVEIDEGLMNAITAIAGSGPAFICEIADAIAAAGVKFGFKYNDALKIALQTIGGTITYLTENKIHPISMRDKITSPAGTTIYGLSVINKSGLKGNLMETFEETKKRADELS
jgi:pyrroline-5-carboxylate reductase